ncbi:hypothetical protein PHJA_001830500 [Phtheirospermum japonicum]|uniref:VQ domain-containing protein n=1 Tax=Phtheirospermum japonicum TaxID=374723 RepID=A0A830CKU4_9LAMI|nr:hypothetical protein PHJA_001830500 [Phtheirospermum japonicum]
MDSGNSASIQSSNGGDDQDLLDSSSSFLNPSPKTNSAPHQHLFLTHQNPTLFDPPKHTNNLDQHDLIWSMGLRSQQNYFSNFGNSSSVTSSRTQSQPGPFPSPSEPEAHVPGASVRPDHPSGVIKNPKKRARASRRATTTVLKTDTTNFRQMVQEFTGFPAAASLPGPPYSRPPDIFSAAVRPGAHLDTPGPIYPIRPFSPLFPSLLNPSTIDSIVTTANIVSTNHDMSGFQSDLQDNDILQKQ